MAQKQTYTKGPDPREAELVENMRLDVMDYIFGRGSASIVKTLKNSTNTPLSMATIAYKAVRGAAIDRKANATVDMDMDMMMGVTTDAIDMLTEVAQAANQILPGQNVQQLKEDTLLRTITLHGEQLEKEGGDKGFSPEMQEAAATDLRDYMSDGGTQKAFDYINNRAKNEGLNPYDMMRAGNEQALGARKPIAAEIKKGLMGNAVDERTQPLTPPEDVGMGGGDQPLMGDPGQRTPEQQPAMPRGEGLVPSGTGLPPMGDPNAAPPMQEGQNGPVPTLMEDPNRGRM